MLCDCIAVDLMRAAVRDGHAVSIGPLINSVIT